MAYRPTGYLGDEVQRFSQYGKHQRLHLRSVKLITDGMSVTFEVPSQHTNTKRYCRLFTGAIGSWGAAMYEPYSDNPSTSGFLAISPETLRKEIPKYLEGGWQVVSPA